MVSNATFQNRFAKQATTAAPSDGLAAIKQQLAASPLNASRVVELGKNAHGAEGQPIGLPKDRLVKLHTGSAALDQVNQAASKLSKFGLKSTLDVTKSTLKGGAYGSICGAIFGVLFAITARTWGGRFGLALGLATVGGLMGSVMRGFQSVRKNMNAGMALVRNGIPQEHSL